MSIAFYNTLTRTIDEFKPLNDGEVRMYCCGPTVYDYFHIGNARSFVMSDVIRRYFEFRGYRVRYVMNITDIDDKIIRRANEQGVPSSEIANTYAEAFLQDSTRFGIRPADLYPRATETIDDIISHIEGLIEKGAAYVVDGDVFFRVSSFPEYGKLSRKKVEDLEMGARVETDARKEHPVDFALWKSAKPGEPSWDSPWGKGRPGWHIECSVMSQKHLGETFDIHAGGNDLIFPHHENEIAQSEALTGHPFARYWIHFGFLNIDNEKMSKSLGNFFTAREIVEKYPAEVIRFYYLQTHYRSPLNFTQEGLEAARTGLQKLQGVYDALAEATKGDAGFDVHTFEQRFTAAMDDDFNTPAGFGVLFEMVREANAILHGPTGMDAPSRERLRDFLHRSCVQVFGVIREESAVEASDEIVDGLMQLLIDIRTEARKEKQWALSDHIRDGLKEIGIALEDTRDGTKWKITSE
ncbi:MAG: cysteine--tRNA ligase [Bacteroidetes bacterium]|nr:cysteine--tRNA ligase [Bacteroidota bacterium]